MTFFTQSSTTLDTTPKSFTKIDWDLVKQNVTAFDIYRQLANHTGISLQECFFNNKVDLSPYEIEDPEIDNYISSVPLFSELEKKYPFTMDRSNSLVPTTHRRNIARNMVDLSLEAYKIWDGFPVTNDNDRKICLKMLKNRQQNRRDKVLFESFVNVGGVLEDLLNKPRSEFRSYVNAQFRTTNALHHALPCNRDAFFRLFGEYAHKNTKTDNAVRYSHRLGYVEIWELCVNKIIDQFFTYEEAERLVYLTFKHDIDYIIENKKSLSLL